MKKSTMVVIGALVVMTGGALVVGLPGLAAAALAEADISLMQVDRTGRETVLWKIRQPDGTQEDGGDDDGTILWEIVVAENTSTTDGGDDDGTVLWEIVVAENTSTTDGGGDDDGTILWEIVIAESSALACEVRDGVLVDSLTGRSLFQARGDAVYRIGSRTPSYRFVRDRVERADGSLVLRADSTLSGASDGRKLVIAALLHGFCGSSAPR